MSPPLGDEGIQFYRPFVEKWFPCNNLKTLQHNHFKITRLEMLLRTSHTDQVRILLCGVFCIFRFLSYGARRIVYFFVVQLSLLICVVYVFEDCMFYVLSVLFEHRRCYLIDNQTNLIVICPLNWINTHRWSAECCQQKHEIIFTNLSLFVSGTTLLTKYVYAFKKWRQISFCHSYSYISFHLY